ncbi:SpvB/TcaC N-terminal domain-containing protein [Haliangium ochraceum]|uniref:YD repeat protein n=1 Tax=Haliangium ochraceum (strain DSM 14365 / JCM 11303 / SMP-2) TaxID=502025 RepID=D0LPS9_HALO1|nr:SpvB/TcaC N-terminal domain-containing protein [Haliangium ochraceum]ACY15442.1 YD repeat protein [Haliangium ochraceum DSM 14365]
MLLTGLACTNEEEAPNAGDVAVHRLTPRSLETSGDVSAAWALFDRDTTSKNVFSITSLDGQDIIAHLDEGSELEAIKVFGASPFQLTLLDPQGQLVAGPHALDKLPSGWTTFLLPDARRVEQLTLRFEPTGDGDAAVSEIEFWGRGASLPLDWEPSATDAPPAGLADIVPGTPDSQQLSRAPSSAQPACASFDFELSRHPGSYRRAWLRYQTDGVFRPLVLTRAFNDAPVTRGFWVPPMADEAGAFVHRVDTEHLRLGHNQVEFCLPGEAARAVAIRDIELVAELDHGSNIIESVSVAPIDGVPTYSAIGLLRDGHAPVAVTAGQELVIAFERWIAPEVVSIAADATADWSLRCVDADGAARDLPATLAEQIADRAIYTIDDATGARCAGLRMRPALASGEAAVTDLRVFGSGTDRRGDFPRIVLASAREHFGNEAWVDGWAHAPAHVGGGVRVRVDDQDTDTTTGVFTSMLRRTSDPKESWPVTITARFGDGSTFTRQYVLDRDGGTMPGAEARDPVLDDGLTEAERRARFGDEGDIAEAEVAPGESKRIELGTDVTLDIPAGAMQGRKSVSITHLSSAAIPPMDPGLVNVTAPFRRGYEFRPHGELFDDALTVTLPYQPSLLPSGYVAEDIQTFYYNETEKRWEPLARAKVERGRQVVESLTDHFTTMINAVVVAPESPQIASFDPNRLKGIEAASPAARVGLIEPPQVNARGDATMQYPLDIPAGRRGVQPSLGLSYSSARGNGWLGVGWDLGTSAIEIETRWGVPRYHATLETETYLIDGTQLSPTAHRDLPKPRAEGTTRIANQTVKVFRPRTEGGFARIVRHGDSPQSYWWEVTSTQGVRSFYGGTPESGKLAAATLSDDSGNVFRWALREIRDTHGNRVRFDYDAVTWSAPGAVPGRELYLASAHYTLRQGESTAPYRVVLVRDPCTASSCRPDVLVSGRGGFKQVTAERLGRIEVYYRQTLVRAWQLEYDQGPFGKSRLRGLRQFGVGGEPFPGNVHTFHYYDEVTQSASTYSGFAASAPWHAGNETPDSGLVLPGGIFDAVGEGEVSALGGSHTVTVGGHLYAGLSFGLPDKKYSIGAKFGTRSDETDGRAALVDIDGDGLPDRVFRGSGGYYFNRNESGPLGPPRFAAAAQPVANLPALSRESSRMSLSVGAEGYFFPAQFHANTSFSSAEQDTYLSDVNADGLVDLVHGGAVTFSYLDETGKPRFHPDSTRTPAPIGVSRVSYDALPPSFEDPALEHNLDDYSPPVDTVRRWQAPYSGQIRITGDVALAAPQRDGADGVRATIEYEGEQQWSHDFGPAETQPQRPSLMLDVAAGERVYFRIHGRDDERDDRVRWSPVIEYLDLAPGQDENGLDHHRFDAAAEFTLAGRADANMNMPFSGRVRLTGRASKSRETSDDIEIRVLVDGAIAFAEVLPAAAMTTVNLDQALDVEAGSVVALRIHSDSPVDLTAFGFDPVEDDSGAITRGPRLRYEDARDQNGDRVPVEGPGGAPIFDVPVAYDMTTYALRMPEMPAPAYVPAVGRSLRVHGRVDAGNAPFTGTVTLTAKSRNRLLAKAQVVIEDGGGHDLDFDLQVEQGEPVFFSFSVSDPDLFGALLTSLSASGAGALPYLTYAVAPAGRLSHPYRGWSYGGYSGAGARGDLPIPPGELDKEPVFDGSEPLSEDNLEELARRFVEDGLQAFPFLPVSDAPACEADAPACDATATAHWQGPHELIYVTAHEMSTMRLGGPVKLLPAPSEIANARAVPRLSRSRGQAIGGGAVPVSFSQGQGESHGLLDFLDMNGDGFPDVVTPARVQYTSPLGVLSENRNVGARDLRITSNENTTIGIGGNIANAIATARGLFGGGAHKAGGGTASSQQMQPIGFTLSLGASEGEASSEADLMDVNGDGLPDRVWQQGGQLQVALNLGYRFAAREPWGQAVIHEGETEEENGGATLGFNDGLYGFSGGLNGSRSFSRPASGGGQCQGTLMDVNGDGLIDCAQQAGNGLRVWFNRGHRIAGSSVLWNGAGGAGIGDNQSTTLGGGVYFTIGFGFGFVNFIINPGGDAAESVGRPIAAIRDIDGDGYPDHLVSTTPHEIRVARNRTGRTNLLRQVERPLGATITLDYTRTGNTQAMPQSRWALSEVQVYDGQADSAALGEANDYAVQRVAYESGRHDRYEREFYGFAKVTVETLDTRDWDGTTATDALPVYRRQEMTFYNGGYHERGLLASTRMSDGDGAVFARTLNQYELRDAIDGRVLTPTQAARAASVFPALVQEHRYHHEGAEDAFIHTFTTQDYDGYGNVIALYDAGGPGASDDYRAEIRYTGRLSACRAHHIVGVADRIEVRDAAGALLRQRESDVACGDATGNVRQLRVSLEGAAVAQTDLAYDGDGNLRAVTAPPNHRGQRYQLDYTYDSDVATYVVRTDDSFGYYATSEYDLRFGAPLRETDINGNSVTSSYDAFGRAHRVSGPYELERGLAYAIEFGYAPDAAVPFATTAHMDVFRNAADPIETVTFVDGLGRVTQTKKDGTLHRGVDAPAEDVMIVSGRTLHDPWGRAIAQWFPTEEPKNDALNQAFKAEADGSAPPTEMRYDVLDRTLETVIPDGTLTSQSYALASALSGNGLWLLTTTIDAEDNRGDAYRDARGNIRAVVEYLDGRGITTRYEYDPLQQIRRVFDAEGNLTRSEYDLAGRRTDVVHPDSGLTEMVYDAAGNLVRRITANLRREGGAIEYGYDFTHLTEIRYPRYADNDVTYTWGTAGLRGAGGNQVGRIVRVDDNSGFQEQRYGALGEVVFERRSIDSHTMGESDNSPEIYVTQYLYDTWGRLQQMIYPDTEVLTYAYDSGGLVRAAEGVKLGTQFRYLSRLEYDRFSQRVFQETGNGIRSHYAYDAENRRLRTLEAGEFQRLEYGYDNVGNVLSLVNDVPNARPNEYGGRTEQSFSYDDLYRLTGASGTWHQPPNKRNQYTYTMQYDDIHNIRAKEQRHWIRNRGDGKDITQHKTTYAWGYDYGSEKPHAATHVGDRTFFYDDNGNQVGWDHDQNGLRRTIVWDEENRVRSISDNGRTTDFVYDHGGERVVKSGAQGETVYVNDKWTVRNRSVGTKHVYVGTTRIASKLSPGDAHVRPDERDLVSVMLGKWWEHRSENGHEHGRNVEMNPHYQIPSDLPDDGMPDTNFLYFYHPDHIGSTSFVTDVDGALYEHVQYFPSGETWVDQRTNTERTPHLFSGKELDQETGLYYFGARYYDPRVGLWASADPAQTEYLDGAGVGGVFMPINLATYTYAANNPIRFVDPDGRYWLDWVQAGLDATSLALDATGIGAAVSWAPDLVNAGISAGRGDWVGAGLSVSAAVPFIGATANATRVTRTVLKNSDDIVSIGKTVPKAKVPYKRPSGATTPAQRAFVQGKPCVDCGHIAPKQFADHKTPLVKEHYEIGSIDKTRMKEIDAVQPHCPTCSASQGGKLRQYSLEQRKILEGE